MKKFDERCYELLRLVPKGRVTTYKKIANALQTKAFRAVGRAMRHNPYAPFVPCHRCVSSDGSIGGFRGTVKGEFISLKIKMLEKEGMIVENNKIVNFDEIVFDFF